MSTLTEAKAFLEGRFPGVYGSLQQLRYKRTLRRVFSRVVSARGLTVQAGPFAGLTYAPDVATPERLLSHALLPKLLGSYEEELHDAVSALSPDTYSRILNIGCAEGYYAVGFARTESHVPILAFDTDPEARKLFASMAHQNGVTDRVTLGSECTVEYLKQLATERALVISDCEGCERYLFSPQMAPYLRTCDLIVELHDCVDPTISRTVPPPFAATHQVQILPRRRREPSDYPALKDLPSYWQSLAVNEFRWGTIMWGVFRARGV
jgi:hypothetical protein